MRFPVSSAELNRRETVGSTPEVKLQAAKAFANPPPAIVQASQLTPGQFKAEVTVCVRMWGQYTDRLLELYESFTKRWEDFGRTRDLAAEEVFGSSWHAIKERIKRLTDITTVTVSSETDDTKAVAKSETLKRISQLPKPEPHPKDADEWEEKEHYTRSEPEEKPCVKAATPDQMKGNGAPKTENGRPKYALAVWRELEESHFGRALNRIDELNRQCPNPVLHAKLIAADKQCLAILDEWKQGVIHG